MDEANATGPRSTSSVASPTPASRRRGDGSAGQQNWAGNHTYRAHTLHRPSTVEQLQELVAAAPRIRVLGTRHCFTDIADSAELVVLDGLPDDVTVDHAAGTASVPAAMTYGALGRALRDEGVALANLASLPHISVAGAVTTATHGSGDATGNLATAVAGLELVTSSGELVTAARGDADFAGMVVGLGALGAVTRLDLDVQPGYDVVQRTYEGLPWDALLGDLDGVMAAGYSVSVLTRWGDAAERVWVKHRTDLDSDPGAGDLFGARHLTDDPHSPRPIDLTAPGPWSDRLPHFAMDQAPSVGDELQAEWFVPRRHAVGALQAVRDLADVLVPVLHITELRTVAADELWMSPQQGQDTLAIACTLQPRPARVADALVEVEAALAPLGARPHWGKLFHHDAAAIADLYPRRDDFVDLAGRLDPRGAIRNAWFEARVLGA